jgi:MtrB/PioB family decaheme-associated outer membrane protein
MRRDFTIRALRSFATTLLTAFSVGLLAAAGGAEEDTRYHDLTTHVSTIELGTFYSSDDDFKFSDYTGVGQGFEADGWSILGNVDLRRRSAFDAEDPYYYRVQGLNLGLDSRFIDAQYKRPGLFGIDLFYDEIPKYQTDSAQTFMLNAGAEYLTLPPTWTITSISNLDPFLYVNEIDHKRKTAGGEFSWILPSHFDFDASYQYQTKRGEKLSSTVINFNSQIVPEPLKYDTHQIDSHLRYTGDDVQLQLEYYASGFYNDVYSLVWQDPRTGGAGVGFDDNGLGQKGSMPDNWFHQVTGSGGINLPTNSRFMVNAAFGWETQNDAFLPYTINPNLTADPGAPLGLNLPRSDLDGKLETRLVTARFVSNPLPKLGINIGYRWNDRHNDTPIETYYRVRSDSGNQNVSFARVNRPYSFEQHKVDADVSYEVYKRTKLTLLYEWDRMTRNLQEVEENNEHSVGGKLVSHPNRYVNLGARYERSYRDRGTYDCVEPYIAGSPPGSIPNPGCPTVAGSGLQFENSPLLRKYYMANRRRNDAHVWMTLTPLGNVSISSHLKFIDDDYYKSTYGLTAYRMLSTGLDVSYAATDALNFHAFYNHDTSRSEMESTSSATSFNPINEWSSKDKNTTNTVGAGFDYDVLPDWLSVGFEYLFAKSVGRVDTVTAAGGPISPPFPNNETSLHDFSVQGDLQFTRNLSMRVGYLFEMFDSFDWATKRVCPACMSPSNAVVASGESPPEYNAHLVSLSLIYRFW